jgi:hypothetical protein
MSVTTQPKSNNSTQTKDLAKTAKELVSTDEPKKATDAFVAKIQRNFQGAGEQAVRWTDLQARLAQHLAVKTEMALDAHEIKRQKNPQKKNDPPVTWENVNMESLMIKAKNCIDLELDAAMPNHVNVVPYLNGRTKKYDVDVRPGYEGVLHSKKKFALVPPTDVICKLAFDGDEFEIAYNEAGGEEPRFKPKSYFKPGPVIGGFGHIKFANPALNRVIVVDEYEFEKARKAAQSKDFWGGEFYERKWNDEARRYENVGEPAYDSKFERDMQYKTVVLRVCKHLKLDPAKVNSDAWIAMEAAEVDAISAGVAEDIAENANAKELPAPQPQEEPAEPAPEKELF